MKFPHKSSLVAGPPQGRKRKEGIFRGASRDVCEYPATSVAGRINQNAGHSLAGRAPTPGISHFCPRNASIYIIFPINSSGEALPTRLGALLRANVRADSFPPSCADSRAKHVSTSGTSAPSFLSPPRAVKNSASFTSLGKRKSARWMSVFEIQKPK